MRTNDRIEEVENKQHSSFNIEQIRNLFQGRRVRKRNLKRTRERKRELRNRNRIHEKLLEIRVCIGQKQNKKFRGERSKRNSKLRRNTRIENCGSVPIERLFLQTKQNKERPHIQMNGHPQ